MLMLVNKLNEYINPDYLLGSDKNYICVEGIADVLSKLTGIPKRKSDLYKVRDCIKRMLLKKQFSLDTDIILGDVAVKGINESSVIKKKQFYTLKVLAVIVMLKAPVELFKALEN